LEVDLGMRIPGPPVSQTHTIAEVGRDLRRSSSPTPCSEQGQLEQAAQGCVEPGFAYLQGREPHSISGQPLPVDSWHRLSENQQDP